MIRQIKHKYYEYELDIELKSKRVFVYIEDKEEYSKIIFDALKLYFCRHGIKEVYMYDWRNPQQIEEIRQVVENKDAFIVIKNYEILVDTELAELLNSSKCQELYFGRNNKDLSVGENNLACIEEEEGIIMLEYPYVG